MVNSLDSYKKWEDIVGKGRILPAFPGAGGSINNDGILDAALTPMMIQPTTFAEISGNKSERTKQLSEILRHAHIPYQKVVNMQYVAVMSSCHGGADCRCILRSRLPGKSGKRLEDYEENSKKTEKNFSFLRKQARLSPCKMNIFRFYHLPIMTIMLAVTFESSFGDKFMYQHARKAPD